MCSVTTGKGCREPASWRGSSSWAAAPAPALLPTGLWLPLGPGTKWQRVLSPPTLPCLCVPGHSQLLHAQPALTTLWTLLALHGQKSPGYRPHLPPVGAQPPVSPSRSRWEQFDKKYLSQLLMRKSAYRLRDEIWDVYYKLNIRDAISFVDQVGARGRSWAGGCRRGGPRGLPVAVGTPPAHLCHPPGWPRAVGRQAGAALHAQPHVHVGVVGHKPAVSTSTPLSPSPRAALAGPLQPPPSPERARSIGTLRLP